MNCLAVRKVLLWIALAGALAITSQAEFQSGELLSVTSTRGLDNVATHRFAVFTVQVGDVIYTGSGKRIKHSSDDFSEGLNPGDAIHASIQGNDMILRKPDGGEVKTKIIKRMRAQ
ncbi:MAG TPA: hypothetical protein VK708_04465 [Bryobacteraceae bacterium]|jgi:hypothetical protein|nr:hypothetical protein [Bryobacteraceae bacterium]